MTELEGMKRVARLILALALVCVVNAGAATGATGGEEVTATGASVDITGAAEARGWLNLAYDSFDSKLFAEAESYLKEAAAGSPVEEDIVYLLVEVLYRQEKYKECVALLEGGRGQVLPERVGLLEDLYSAWSWTHIETENFKVAKELVDKGTSSLGGSDYLSSLSRAYAYREDVRVAASRRRDAKLKGGGKLSLSKLGEADKDGDWLRVCPPSNEVFRTAVLTCEDWLPLTAAELDGEGLALWIAVEPAELMAALEFEAGRLAMTVNPVNSTNVLLRDKGSSTAVDVEELRTRCAVEGLGIRSAALMAAHEARDELDGFAELLGWVKANIGELTVTPYGNGITLEHPGTERTFELGYLGWLDLFSVYPDDWSVFWGELSRELGREARPYRCFCGREVFVRESYLSKSGAQATGVTADELTQVEGDRWGVVAYCQKHRMLLGDETLAEWGVSRAEVLEKCRLQAIESPWELLFRTLRISGGDVFFLTGGGATALSRNTDVLLGVVEQFQGRSMAGETIKVWAPADEVLIVGGVETTAEEVGVEADKFLRMLNMPHVAPGLYNGFEETIRLPQKRRGTVRLQAME
jgi:hypothetical protein